MQPDNKLFPVIIGTFTMTFIALFPILNLLNLFCCAGIMAGGFAGVFYYSRQLVKTGQTVSSKDGGMIGILSGVLSAVIISGFGLVFSLFSNQNPMNEMINTFDSIGVDIPPTAYEFLEKFSNEFNEHGYSPTLTIFSFITNLIIYPLFGSIGAIIGVSVLKKKTAV